MSSTPGSPQPWLASQLSDLLKQRGHAWLLHGPSGLGQYSLALELAKAWLCEAKGPAGACGKCTSCHAIDVHSHADLCVLMPEVQQLALGWPLSEKAQSEIDDKKRKASKEIRIEAMRDAVEFAQRTSARGLGKVVLVYPAEQMNTVTANALLKTLEEPAGDMRFVLASESVHQLLPTIRSRCISHAMVWPNEAVARDWLMDQGVPQKAAAACLRMTGNRPDDALALSLSEAQFWDSAEFVRAMMQGQALMVKDWSVPRLLDQLQKLCHDCMAVSVMAKPRFFELGTVPQGLSMRVLNDWSKALAALRNHMDHPFQQGLAQEALVAQAQSALNSKF